MSWYPSIRSILLTTVLSQTADVAVGAGADVVVAADVVAVAGCQWE